MLKIILLGLSILLGSGCGLLPAPLSYVNYGWTAHDTYQGINDDPTITDAALSMTTGMDCQLVNVLGNKEICVHKAVYRSGYKQLRKSTK